MKKTILLILTLILYSSFAIEGYCNEDSQEFMKNFSTCKSWMNNGEKRISIILGWSTRKCHYQEVSHYELVNCAFKQLELQDMVNIMKRENFDYTQGLTSLKGADKYLYYSPEICTVESRNNRTTPVQQRRPRRMNY